MINTKYSISNNTEVSLVQYFPDYQVVSSVTKAPFVGNIEIEYTPGKWLLEFVAFDEWLKSISMQEFTLESLCCAVFDKVSEAVGYTNLSVTVHAKTTLHSPAVATKVRNIAAERQAANRRIAIPKK